MGPEGDPAAQACAALIDPVEDARNARLARQSDVAIFETKYKAKRAVEINIAGEEQKVKKGELLDGSELVVNLVADAFERVSVERKR